jgi:ribonuclease R
MDQLKVGAIFEGSINISTKAIGYVKVKDLGISIEVPKESLNRAFHSDIVKVEVTAIPKDANPIGKVIEITKRSKVGYSGTLTMEGGAFCISTNDGRMYTPIQIPSSSLNGAKQGDKVFCSITDWDNPMSAPIGKVTRILGLPLENNAEMLSLALEKGFNDTYPEAVLEEAKQISEHGITEEEKNNRRDFRKITTFTIDPEDAKDFDDAISIEFLPDGNTEVGVHIADVSHYVIPKHPIDEEASERATSVYLVDRTIPMLPEVLSNDLCSLMPDVDRLTFSAVFTFTPEMKIVEEWFGKTVIHSHKRFSYESAQKVLDDDKGEFLKELQSALAISKFLEKERFANGAISIDTEEVKFKLDNNGHPIGVYKKVRGETHHMIEELMLLANRKVAEFIATREKKLEEIFVYRIHESPSLDRMNDLELFLKRLGYNVKTNKEGIIPSKALNDLMMQLEGKPEKETIQTAIVRSMQKAIYSTKNIGHYGLAFQYYTHFTSPIRRYPDLVVHRLLYEYLQEHTVPKSAWEYYEKISLHSSIREKEASDAERGSIKYKQTEYMSDRIGQIFNGVVTGVSQNGMFVEEKETKCEGMIRMRDIGNDYFEYNDKELAIVGKRTKKTFRIGDAVRFKVSSTDIAKRLIDYVLV